MGESAMTAIVCVLFCCCWLGVVHGLHTMGGMCSVVAETLKQLQGSFTELTQELDGYIIRDEEVIQKLKDLEQIWNDPLNAEQVKKSRLTWKFYHFNLINAEVWEVFHEDETQCVEPHRCDSEEIARHLGCAETQDPLPLEPAEPAQ